MSWQKSRVSLVLKSKDTNAHQCSGHKTHLPCTGVPQLQGAIREAEEDLVHIRRRVEQRGDVRVLAQRKAPSELAGDAVPNDELVVLARREEVLPEVEQRRDPPRVARERAKLRNVSSTQRDVRGSLLKACMGFIHY